MKLLSTLCSVFLVFALSKNNVSASPATSLGGQNPTTTQYFNYLRGSLNRLSLGVAKLRSAHSNAAAIPVGFVYTQLPGQAEPTTVWPGMGWEDISAHFAGLFFRTLGGSSAGVGVIQAGDAPRISEIRVNNGAGLPSYRDIPMSWSQHVGIGIYGSERYGLGMKVHTANTEVRPKNMAVKLWKRIK